jgi:hypothetical protein
MRIVQLNVMRIQVPRAMHAAVEPIWNYLREDVLDSLFLLQLERNGFRVGVGHARWWEAVKTTFDAIDGRRTDIPNPLRMPSGVPVALELDSAARTQMIFYSDSEGILRGGTWPESRNVLRVLQSAVAGGRVRWTVAPEVRQVLEGTRWVRAEGAMWQEPRSNALTYTNLAFSLDLSPDEFLLIAPSRKAPAEGLVGGAMLTSARLADGEPMESYIVLWPEAKDVAARGE